MNPDSQVLMMVGAAYGRVVALRFDKLPTKTIPNRRLEINNDVGRG